MLGGAGELGTALPDAVHKRLVCAGDRTVAVAAGGLAGEVGEVAEVGHGRGEGGEGGTGGLGGAREREADALEGGRGLVGIAVSGTVAERVFPDEEAQEAGQMADFVIEDLAQCRIGADLVEQGRWSATMLRRSATSCSSIRWSGSEDSGNSLNGCGAYRRAADVEPAATGVLLATADAAGGGERRE